MTRAGAAPILPRIEADRARRFCLIHDGGRKHVRYSVRCNRDHAHRAFGLERSEPLHHLGRRQAKAAARAHFDGNEIAVIRISAGADGDRNLPAELLLVDRGQPCTAVRQRAVDAEDALLGAVEAQLMMRPA